MKVLITGGAGYIGSTVASACADDGITPIILDDLSTGRAELAAGRHLFRGDVGDPRLIDAVFAAHPDITATVHCAALVVVPESVRRPIPYYRTNVGKTVEFADGLLRNGCRRLIYSSSASVYAQSPGGWVDEQSPIRPTSPYGRTKAFAEAVLEDVSRANGLQVLSLRYFNPIGADPHGRSGPPAADPGHVLGRLMRAYRTGRPFRITGVTWDTRDGTGIRDYVHIWDLARAHVRALHRFDEVAPPSPPGRYEVVNLGTGDGTTVRELIAAFEQVVGCRLETLAAPARPGDVCGNVARSDKAARLLGWHSRLTVSDGIRHALEWETQRRRVLQPQGLVNLAGSQ
ncbi:UDP-glucose 4-epimerase GalE [Actinoplanes sp. NPDC049681]|uniref:UDP-glucose 4-epimerase GalE n=1 Tax=Actinoplanes sp. NPDC049681 TaxID=3363905 RepID=UPI0037ACE494